MVAAFVSLVWLAALLAAVLQAPPTQAGLVWLSLRPVSPTLFVAALLYIEFTGVFRFYLNFFSLFSRFMYHFHWFFLDKSGLRIFTDSYSILFC